MNTPLDTSAIADWVVGRGLAGLAEADLLSGFCARCRDAGLDLSRGTVIIDTLHPVYQGRAFRWRADAVEEAAVVEYGRTGEGDEAATWRNSVFFHLLETGGSEYRQRLDAVSADTRWPTEQIWSEGHTDYVAFIHRFSRGGSMGDMDCVYSHWETRRPDGFSDGQLDALRGLLPPLALAIKCGALARIARTLVEVYLGRDAGARVLDGHVARGVAERIEAVLWFSDLRGYTAISDAAEPAEIIPFLNDYADCVISAVHAAEGQVLKLIGDGVLAIFGAQDPGAACARALLAERQLRRSTAALNTRRAAEGQPVTDVYLGLHIGEVFYGNIGSQDRLDFTVVGRAVNETSRIATLCRSVERPIVLSAAFAAAAPAGERARLVSLGRFALRGVGQAQDLFTLDPGLQD